MQIRKNSILSKIYHWYHPNVIQTNICDFGWFVFVVTPLLGLCVILCLGIVILIFGGAFYHDPKGASLGFALGLSPFVLYLSIRYLIMPLFTNYNFGSDLGLSMSIFKAWVKAKKERYCTKVEIVE